jgi:hypothetical protein
MHLLEVGVEEADRDIHLMGPVDLRPQAWLDHVAATYTGDRRSSASFISSDCVVMDIDNDHTDNPDEWITPDDLAELMAGGVDEPSGIQRLRVEEPEPSSEAALQPRIGVGVGDRADWEVDVEGVRRCRRFHAGDRGRLPQRHPLPLRRTRPDPLRADRPSS